MNLTAEQFTEELREKVESFDKEGAEELCQNLITHLYRTTDSYPSKEAEKVLQILRNKRMFLLMEMVGDALIQTGQETFKIRRQYAQSLIDQGSFTAAISVLKILVSDTQNAMAHDPKAAGENIEARGLIGRAYKQLYVNANTPSNTRNQLFLKESIKAYLDVYDSSRNDHIWHGINVVALLRRAKRDGVDLPGSPDGTEMAKAILQEVRDRDGDTKAEYWDFATAAEACIALEKPDEALKWIARYIRARYVDAFEIATTLRQLTEVWQFDMNSNVGKQILPILRAELLSREGGRVILDSQELRDQKIEEDSTTASYEKVFGIDSFNTYKWYMTGADRCLAVARIGRETSQGHGTGFLIKGSALSDKLNDDPVLVTNAHVVSDDPYVRMALPPEEAVIIFEALGSDEFKVGKILWTSPPRALDTTIIQFDDDDIERLKKLTQKVKFYPIAKTLPVIDNTQRLYVIGHPFGGTLSISLQDNILLDYQDPRIHYRTPTEGGSSGSPVFNRQWQLIGIHHKGDKEMPMLNDKKGTYEANEGIWIKSIMNALAKELQ
jgi:V8-like Glu-specific endopeptidase